MAKPKTLYSLKGIFTNLLEDTEKSKFLIPTYQRGYKWASSGGNSQVEVLLRDLTTAFERGRGIKYYLQFISLQENKDEFEVIDGQQRLTTLTILFSILYSLKPLESQDNFVKGKLKYQARENFIEHFIYNNINQIIISENWGDFIDKNKSTTFDIDNQDVYFIYHTTKTIFEYLTNIITDKRLIDFYNYLCEEVIIIINLLDKDLNSEKIFINVNKGVKLKDEDLVKGLLITKIPLDNQNHHYRITENEINEIRINIGRQWDELCNWALRKDIRSFFKSDLNENDTIGWLISLTYPDIKESNDDNIIFSYIDKLHRENKIIATEIFSAIRKTMLTLNDWYNEPEIRNLLGFILHEKKSYGLKSIWKELRECKTKSEIQTKLKVACKKALPINPNTKALNEINYEDHKNELFNLFLILDVAKFLPIEGRKGTSYDFSKISLENWSIEHIFPQKSKDFRDIKFLGEADLAVVKELLPVKFDELKSIGDEKKTEIRRLFNKIKKAANKCIITDSERDILELLLENKANNLHQLGNLALLQKAMNSGLSNNFFDGKRKKIVKKVSEGHFVPFHTYDVFSKLIIDSRTGLHVWTKSDIDNHEKYVKVQVEAILNYLN